MLEISRYCLVAATIAVALSLIAQIVVSTARATPGTKQTGDGRTAQPRGRGLAHYAAVLDQFAFLCLTACLVLRTIVVHRAPLSNQYEFAVSFVWGIMLAMVIVEWRTRLRALALAVLPVALALSLYSLTLDDTATELMPALQNGFLLPLHVVTASLGYGAAAVSFGAAVLYLLHGHLGRVRLPSRERLDEIGYRSIIIAYPLITLMIILGAIWANVAWGRYWSWDPKETSALVTWLFYSAYLHARVVGNWRGARAAWLLILGFAAVIFTFMGNLFFGGLHSYA
ncbi:MAG: c-type cytochrome biogenesis protein CcsB [Propionibacteriaceae bacterium]|uniref:Cytochr_II_ccsB: cytochrome c-type biogenesis protein CcsB n=1 Tax=Propionibacterium ruminifibrarum TaxID=1962131 RepID=A0A375I033_9ACTN|nr:c-type cytochrome biogenesis protein CcsB [Propionibacterium ruminifibrarum]MBE6477886.1 c-type cytochrome biogenesis protein CcsB [Propionibacteriaceae bacterium]SPF67372.1 cytochr_II_ccsB: cytochrome c-type biogenesis protein CcsB [Propionibacterium ruminifibrarum]